MGWGCYFVSEVFLIGPAWLGRWSSDRAREDGAAGRRACDLSRARARRRDSPQGACRARFRFALDGEFVAALRAATNGGPARGAGPIAPHVRDAVGQRP